MDILQLYSDIKIKQRYLLIYLILSCMQMNDNLLDGNVMHVSKRLITETK